MFNNNLYSKSNFKSVEEFSKELRRRKRIFLEANHAKDEFLANISHELKTPLNSINIISSVMMNNKNGNLSEKDIKSLTIINNAGENLLKLINDILDISDFESDEIIHECDNLNIYSTLNDIYSTFKEPAHKKNLSLILECDKNIDFFNSDANKIKKIIEHLVSNALKFSKKGVIKISAKVINEYLEIEVKDEGIGIEKDKLIHIFDRFTQVDASSTREYGGAGLGLAISKNLCELLDGKISVQSEVGKGSIFKVSIKNKEFKVLVN